MSSSKKETVRAAHLSTGYPAKNGMAVVTRDINAALHAGELTCLLGPNGAGKSTLLRTLTAFQPPAGGEVYVEGRPLGGYTPAELAHVIGVVLTERPQVSAMTVEELVALGRSPYTGFWGRLGDDDRRIVGEAMELTGITSLRGRSVATLSDGERQKAMIAKAIAQDTPVVFLDEPTAFLDYPSKVEITQLLRRLARERGLTVFMSTHDLELALQTADRVWLIDRPHGVVTGTPEDLALDGSLGLYFSREGVTFDLATGQFTVDSPVTRRIGLTGDEPAAGMVRRALARRGIGTEPGGAPEVHVTAGTYTFAGRTYPDIASLLDAVDTITETYSE